MPRNLDIGGFDQPPLLPYPNGWFAVSFSSDVAPGQVRRFRIAGQDVVLYRTRSGLLRAVDPYCPHLGAHLAQGGTVEGEALVCPFHRFAFDVEGVCVRTGYGSPPPKAVLRQHQVTESAGMIWIWHHADHSSPSWDIPPLDLDEYYAKPIQRGWACNTHPQEMIENVYDIGHFSALHGYRSSKIVNPPEFTKTEHGVGVDIERYFPLLGTLVMEYKFHGHGLGYLEFRVRIPRLNFNTLIIAGLNQVSARRTQFRISLYIRKAELATIRSPFVRTALQGSIVGVIRYLLPQLFYWFEREERQDRPIWEAKTYVEHPRLVKGDGPIMVYRKWAAQFYPGRSRLDSTP